MEKSGSMISYFTKQSEMSHLGCKRLSIEGASLLGFRSMTKSISTASDIRDMYETKRYRHKLHTYIHTDVKIHIDDIK